jgi:hypothetical protein
MLSSAVDGILRPVPDSRTEKEKKIFDIIRNKENLTLFKTLHLK